MHTVVFLHYLISLSMYVLICLIPFADRLKRSKRRVFWEATLGCVFFAVLSAVFATTDQNEAAFMVSIAVMVVGFIYYKRTVQDGWHKLLFVFCMAVHTITMGTEFEFAVTTLMGILPLTNTPLSPWYAMLLPLRIAFCLIMVFAMQRLFNPRLRQVNVEDMKWLWVLPAVFTSISIYRGAEYFANNSLDYTFPITFLLLLAASFFLYWQMLRMLDDISKKAHLEADTRRLDELDRMRNELIALVSHETMMPLAVLSGYAELVAMELREKGVEEQTAKDLDNIAEETQRILWLLDELQNQSQKHEGRLVKTKLNLQGLIEGVARFYQPIMAKGNCSLETYFAEPLPDVYACAGEITQVFYNLLQNARNHTESGTVTIRVESGSEGVESFPQFVTVSVVDTGCGIAPELLPRVFERGFSGCDGSGLGLYKCHEIITDHGGTIRVESGELRVESGTKVTFTLPSYR